MRRVHGATGRRSLEQVVPLPLREQGTIQRRESWGRTGRNRAGDNGRSSCAAFRSPLWAAMSASPGTHFASELLLANRVQEDHRTAALQALKVAVDSEHVAAAEGASTNARLGSSAEGTPTVSVPVREARVHAAGAEDSGHRATSISEQKREHTPPAIGQERPKECEQSPAGANPTNPNTLKRTTVVRISGFETRYIRTGKANKTRTVFTYPPVRGVPIRALGRFSQERRPPPGLHPPSVGRRRGLHQHRCPGGRLARWCPGHRA